ncbi:MFS transporter [Paenibacillus puldeungensis]|uniref:MFS transporter n=1 Tax=Paenibacillus puldeungensis TaxID=696536 RepID=A0ABW3RX51_9BACL
MKSTIITLREEKRYRTLFTAGLVNGIGDRFSQVAVLGLLLSLTGSGFAVGITFAIRLFPFLIFGPLGGMIADRFSKKSIMIFTDLIRIFFALVPLLVRTPADIWMIYVSSFFMSAGEAFYAPARMSVIPRLVKNENLLAVNSLEQAKVGFVLIGGSVTGGIVSAVIGGQVSFVLNALSFLVSALLLMRLHLHGELPYEDVPEAANTRPQEIETSGSGKEAAKNKGESTAPLFRDTLQQFREVLTGSLFLRMMVVVFAVWPIGDGIFNILISVYAAQVFHMGDLGIGMLYGALGVGMIAGSGWSGRMSRHLKTAAVLALLLEGCLQAVISQSPSFILLILLLMVSSTCTSIGNACNETVLMTIVPTPLQGRFFGMLATLQNTVIGISMFVSGFLLELISPRTLGLTGGILFTLIGLSVTLLMFRFRRQGKGDLLEE